ncbi:hypothetical protein BU17DRAFT_84366 [Hysterangium stoloniferum]|nr:hypothetical protein BU17DRAFT_84366 [Hysterangium stoloniferum]
MEPTQSLPFSPYRCSSNASPIKIFCSLTTPYNHLLRNYYFVSSVSIYKQEKSKGQHEFVVAVIFGPHQSRSFLVVERTPQESSSIDTFRTLSSNNSVPAIDTIVCLDEVTFVKFVRTRSANALYCLVFDPPPGHGTFPAVDFCHIVASISAYQESYTLLGSSCYWFAGMVMKVVETCFTVKQTRGNGDAAGRCKGLKIFRPEPNAIRDIMASYNTKRSEEGRSLLSIIREEGGFRRPTGIHMTIYRPPGSFRIGNRPDPS